MDKSEQAAGSSQPPVELSAGAEGHRKLNPDGSLDVSAFVLPFSAYASPDARIDMQIRVISYMRQSQVATDWIGTVKSRGITPEGNAWVSIEIADGITVSTWQTERDDQDSATMFRPHAKLFAPAQAAKIAAPIIFSGTILKSVLASDDEMVTHPQFIARFSALKLAQ